MGDRDHSIECEACTTTEYCTPCWDALPYVAGRKFDAQLAEKVALRWGIEHRLATLAANLRMAGALALAFSLGEDFDEACTMGRSIDAWTPGCHRTAPGWAHGEGEK